MSNMRNAFTQNESFNQPLNNWDVSSLTTTQGMFYETKSFNQPLNNWNVSSLTTAWQMFYDAEEFDQDISNWNAVSITGDGFTNYGKYLVIVIVSLQAPMNITLK